MDTRIFNSEIYLFLYSVVECKYSYRIRLPTEKELEIKVSKDVKKMRYYESTLLTVYKVCALIYLHLSMDSCLLVLEIGTLLFSRTFSVIKFSGNFWNSTLTQASHLVHSCYVVRFLMRRIIRRLVCIS